MRQARAQELAVNELRLFTHALSRRFLWASAIGLVCCGFTFWMFAPENFVANIADLVSAQATLELRKLPIFGVREIDIHNYAKASVLVERDDYFWQVLVWVFFSTTSAIFGALTYLFWRKGDGRCVGSF